MPTKPICHQCGKSLAFLNMSDAQPPHCPNCGAKVGALAVDESNQLSSLHVASTEPAVSGIYTSSNAPQNDAASHQDSCQPNGAIEYLTESTRSRNSTHRQSLIHRCRSPLWVPGQDERRIAARRRVSMAGAAFSLMGWFWIVNTITIVSMLVIAAVQRRNGPALTEGDTSFGIFALISAFSDLLAGSLFVVAGRKTEKHERYIFVVTVSIIGIVWAILLGLGLGFIGVHTILAAALQISPRLTHGCLILASLAISIWALVVLCDSSVTALFRNRIQDSQERDSAATSFSFSAETNARGHTGPVYSVSFSPDGRQLVSAGMDKTVKLWDAASGQVILRLKGHAGSVGSVSFSPDGKEVVSGGTDRTVKVWDTATGQEKFEIKRQMHGITSVAFGPDGKHIAFGTMGRTVVLWDLAAGQELFTLKGHADAVGSVSFSPDGKRLVSGSADNTLIVWDVTTGQAMLTLTGHTGAVLSVSFSPDGRRIVSGSKDGIVRIWDAAIGQELVTLRRHAGPVVSVSFSPDGHQVVSGGMDETVKLWEVAAAKVTLTMIAHTGTVLSVSFSPDGKRIVSSGKDSQVIIWDVISGQEMLRLKGD